MSRKRRRRGMRSTAPGPAPQPGRTSQFAPVLDSAWGIVRRHPVLVALVAAGAGWLAWRVRDESRPGWASFDHPASADEVPVINTGQARIYDPDQSPRHPTHDLMETQREISARA